MMSRKAGSRSSATPDVGVSIERWQAGTLEQKNHETELGPIGFLFNCLIETLGLMLLDMKTRPTMSRDCQSLESDSAALLFWGSDFGGLRGGLDETLTGSTELRNTYLPVDSCVYWPIYHMLYVPNEKLLTSSMLIHHSMCPLNQQRRSTEKDIRVDRHCSSSGASYECPWRRLHSRSST